MNSWADHVGGNVRMIEPAADPVYDCGVEGFVREHGGCDEAGELRLLPHHSLGFAAHPHPNRVGMRLKAYIDPLRMGHAVL